MPIVFGKDAEAILRSGGVGVLPTDTIYGLVASAFDRDAVERIYTLRGRNRRKPMIVLIGSVPELKRFGIGLDAKAKKILGRVWPGKVSVVLPCASKRFAYLHRGTKSLAFRLPANKKLRDLLMRTGPLVAPSANREGKSPAATITEAKKYFKKKIDFYSGRKKLSSKPSTLVKIRNGKMFVLRAGAVKI